MRKVQTKKWDNKDQRNPLGLISNNLHVKAKRFNEYRVSVRNDEKVLEMDSGSCTTI